MTHLTMDQLLALREPGVEPGAQAARAHLEACEVCRAELDRLDQRVARLKALPTLRPARSRFTAVQAELQRDRRAQMLRGAGLGGLALAASVALMVVFGPAVRPEGGSGAARVAASDLDAAISRSQQLETMLQSIAPDTRALDGRTAALASRLEDQITLLDRQLQVAGRLAPELRAREQLRLWRERAGLLDALMDVHLTQARYAGL